MNDIHSIDELHQIQLQKLQLLVHSIYSHNPFYTNKLQQLNITPDDIQSLNDLRRLPLTTKKELLEDQQQTPPYGTNLTCSIEQYCRPYQTSGTTTGQPMRWLDTRASWQWTLNCWKQIYQITEVKPGVDRLFFPFSFGPFLGFWSAWEAAADLGLWCMPGGGMTTAARLRFLLEHRATVILCTPTYALHLAETARKEKLDLPSSQVRALIVAGEPGGSIVSTRQRIEQGWGARVFDHAGMTEMGPTAVECPANPAGLHILENEYLMEVIHPQTLEPTEPGTQGELILTNFGRIGSPLIRYRTGDLVKVDTEPCPCGSSYRRLGGGILGRADDMIHLRGNNVHPGAIEAILRQFSEVVEFRIEFDQRSALAQLRIDIELTESARSDTIAQMIDQKIRDELLFRAEIKTVAPGDLPRYEMKAKRFHRITH